MGFLSKEGDLAIRQVLGTDAGGLTNPKELSEGEESQDGGAGLHGGAGFVGKEEEEVSGGPELWWRWGSDCNECTGQGPMEGGDGGWEEAQGFQLSNSGYEAPGCSSRAGVKGHVVQGGREDSSMCEGG